MTDAMTDTGANRACSVASLVAGKLAAIMGVHKLGDKPI